MQRFVDHLIGALDAPLSDSATTLALASGSPLLTRLAALFAGDPAATVQLTLEAPDQRLTPDAAREIVLASAVTDTAVSVTRGAAGTTARAWISGTLVEGRLTAETLGRMPLNAPGGDALGEDALSLQPSREQSDQVASGDGSIALGVASGAQSLDSVAVGAGAWVGADCERAVALGSASVDPGGTSATDAVAIGSAGAARADHAVGIHGSADAPDSVALGRGSWAGGESAVAIGDQAAVDLDMTGAIALGHGAFAGEVGTIALGASAWAYSPGVLIGAAGRLYGAQAVALGPGAAVGTTEADADDAIAIGPDAESSAAGAIAIGHEASASAEGAIAIAGAASAAGAIALGTAFNEGIDSVAIGPGAYNEAERAVCVGPSSYAGATGVRAVSIGHWNAAEAPDGITIGYYSYTDAAAEGSLALGARAKTFAPYTAHLPAIQRHTHFPADFEDQFPLEPSSREARTAHMSAPPTTLMSEPLDLSDDTASIDLVIPPGTLFYVDTVGLIVVESDTPVGTPEISVGTVTEALLTEESVTVTAAGARQLWKDRDSDGLDDTLTVSTVTAVTSGTLTARVYATGLMVEAP